MKLNKGVLNEDTRVSYVTVTVIKKKHFNLSTNKCLAIESPFLDYLVSYGFHITYTKIILKSCRNKEKKNTG